MKNVLVVDDSALVRKQLTNLLQAEGYIVESARNGEDAVAKALEKDYDVITMDVNMPLLDGLGALERIMEKNPTPVIMVSSLTTKDAPMTFDALSLGAVDYVAKPGSFDIGVKESGEDLLKKVRAAARIPKRKLESRRWGLPVYLKNKEERFDRINSAIQTPNIENILLIGASTGGPSLIEEICASLPEDLSYPVCVVQHMPEKFTGAFAERLNRASKVTVKESEHNEMLLPGVVYIAKGGTHIRFSKKVSGKIVIRHGEASANRFFTPSVDEMFFSALEVFEGRKIFAVELTGIGDDGADGMVAIKNAGGYTIAESEESATVYGMPKEAYLRGGASEVLPFQKIVQKIKSFR